MTRYDTGFRPSQHGLPFANNVAVIGECGGFVDLALRGFMKGEPPPETPPKVSLYLRQFMSVFGRMRKIARWTRKSNFTLYVDSLQESPRLKALLHTGVPVPLMLIYGHNLKEVCDDHQVLAYCGDFCDNMIKDIWVYDPNQPKDDGITLASMNARGWYIR